MTEHKPEDRPGSDPVEADLQFGLRRTLRLDPKHKWQLCFDDEYHEDTYSYPPSYLEVKDAREAAPDAWTRLWLLLDGWDSMLVAEWQPAGSGTFSCTSDRHTILRSSRAGGDAGSSSHLIPIL